MLLARKTLKDREGEGKTEDVSDGTRRLTRFIRTLHRNTYGLIGSGGMYPTGLEQHQGWVSPQAVAYMRQLLTPPGHLNCLC